MHIIIALVLIGLLSVILKKIFVNAKADVGFVRYRGFVLVGAIFSIILYVFSNSSNEARIWGYISIFLFFVFVCMMIVRSQSKGKRHSALKEMKRKSTSLN